MPDEPAADEGLAPGARALVIGAVLGAVFGLSNLYVALRLGWSVGVVVTAALLGSAALTGLARLQRRARPASPSELAALAAITSAAGYSTGINLATAASAWAMIDGHHLPTATLVGWTALVALLGVALAWSMRARFVDDASLAFPSARATAELLARLGAGTREAASLRPLALAFVVAAAWEFVTEVGPIAGMLPRRLPDAAWHPFAAWLVGHGLVLELSAVGFAGGALAGNRAASSVAVGTLACWGIGVPWLHATGLVEGVAYEHAIGWVLWFAVPLLVVSSLVDALAQIGVRAAAPSSGGTHRGLVAAIAIAVALWAIVLLDIPVAVAIFGLVAAIALALVCTRIAGETDVVPTGACGKLVQLGLGLASPHALLGNLMATSIATGAAAACADATTDLRCASLLGLPLRRQAIAQAIGVVIGAAVVVPVFVVIVDPAALGTELWPVPAAQAWRAVAVSLSGGWHPATGVPTAMLVGSALGIALPLAARRGPRRIRPWIPSAPALGLGVLFPPATGWGFALGGWIAAAWQTRRRDIGSVIALVCAGAIAGESLVAIVGRIVESALD